MVDSLSRRVRSFLIQEDGAYLIEFALVLPVLILLSFGLLEFSLVTFEYQRITEATRRGARRAIVQVVTIPNTAALLAGTKIVCTGYGVNSIGCVGASVNVDAQTNFALLLAEMQEIFPPIRASNVVLTYEATDLGNPGDKGGIFPMVTIQLIGVKHDMLVGPVLGVSSITLPDFKTTILGNGRSVNAG